MNTQMRLDYHAFSSRIERGACILDVGCGDGALLAYLEAELDLDARGLEITQAGVSKCLARGLSVIQGDAETDLSYFPDNSFEYAILSRTLEALKNPKDVLSQLARISPEILLSFHNQGHWAARLSASMFGRIPEYEGYKWYDTDRLHPVSLFDVLDLAGDLGLKPVAFAAIIPDKLLKFQDNIGLLNLRAKEIFLHLARSEVA